MRFLIPLIALILIPTALQAPVALAETQPQKDWMVHMNKGEEGWSFVPDRIVLVPDGIVQLMIFGNGQFSLTLTDMEGYDADISTSEGTVRTAEFRAPAAPGEYAFHDKYHPEAQGILVVAQPSEAHVIGVIPGGYESRFAPARLEVPAGATVTFRANGSFQHNLQAEDGSFSAGDVRPGNESTFVAPATPGDYPFVCRFHEAQGMRGVLVVTAAAAASPEPAEASPAPGASERDLPGQSEVPWLGAALMVGALLVATFVRRPSR